MTKKRKTAHGKQMVKRKKLRRKDVPRVVNTSSAKVIAGINKALKSDKGAWTLREDERAENSTIGFVPTGLWGLDWLISDLRGVHLGRMMNIWGGTATGKSALAQFIMKAFQDAAGVNILFDFDEARDPKFLRGYGLNSDSLVIPDVSTIEQGFDILQASFESLYGEFGKKSKSDTTSTPIFGVWDSVASSCPQDLLGEKSSTSHHVGLTSRALTDQLKKLRQFCKRRPICVLFLNETRANIGAMQFAPADKQPHAKALEFAMSTIIRTSKGTAHKIERKKRKIVVGQYMRMKSIKARHAPPGRETQFYLSYARDGSGGPCPVRSNYFFLHEQNMLSPGKAVTINGLRDTVGTFCNPIKGDMSEFAGVIEEHGDAIIELLKGELCGSVGSGSGELSEDPFED